MDIIMLSPSNAQSKVLTITHTRCFRERWKTPIQHNNIIAKWEGSHYTYRLGAWMHSSIIHEKFESLFYPQLFLHTLKTRYESLPCLYIVVWHLCLRGSRCSPQHRNNSEILSNHKFPLIIQEILPSVWLGTISYLWLVHREDVGHATNACFGKLSHSADLIWFKMKL